MVDLPEHLVDLSAPMQVWEYISYLQERAAELEACRAVLRRVAHEAPDHFAFKSAAKAVLLDAGT